jgi:hypothetical protein
MVYPALLPLMRTPRLPGVDWTDAPADLNGLVRFAERGNLVSARVPSHFKCSLPQNPASHPPPPPKSVILKRPSESRISRIGLTGCVWYMTTGTNDRAQSTVDAETSSNNKFSSRTRFLFLLTAYRLLVNNHKNRHSLVVAAAVGRGHLDKVRLCFRWTRREGLQLRQRLLEIYNQHSSVGIVTRLWAGPASSRGWILGRGKTGSYSLRSEDSFPEVKRSGRETELPHLAPRLWMSGAIPPFPTCLNGVRMDIIVKVDGIWGLRGDERNGLFSYSRQCIVWYRNYKYALHKNWQKFDLSRYTHRQPCQKSHIFHCNVQLLSFLTRAGPKTLLRKMKSLVMVNGAVPKHANIWGRGGTLPHSNGCRCVTSFKFRSL